MDRVRTSVGTGFLAVVGLLLAGCATTATVAGPGKTASAARAPGFDLEAVVLEVDPGPLVAVWPKVHPQIREALEPRLQQTRAPAATPTAVRSRPSTTPSARCSMRWRSSR